jgi:hypothetical protein
LRKHETIPGFALLILRAIELPTTPEELRQSAAVLFKNFVKVRWHRQDTHTTTSGDDVAVIVGVRVDAA